MTISWLFFVSSNAFAEPGSRTCIVVSEKDVRHGLVVKVDKSGQNTCNQKVAFMKQYYAIAYPYDNGPFQNVEMLTCEKFSQVVMGMGGNADVCPSLTKNYIYKYTVNDSFNKAGVKFWHQ